MDAVDFSFQRKPSLPMHLELKARMPGKNQVIYRVSLTGRWSEPLRLIVTGEDHDAESKRQRANAIPKLFLFIREKKKFYDQRPTGDLNFTVIRFVQVTSSVPFLWQSQMIDPLDVLYLIRGTYVLHESFIEARVSSPNTYTANNDCPGQTTPSCNGVCSCSQCLDLYVHRVTA